MRRRTLCQALPFAPFLARAAWPQTSGAPPASLGLFETRTDVGVTPKTGAIEYNTATNEYRLTGGGANVWGAEDAFSYLWKRLVGDATLTADVQFIGTGAVAHRKAMLMIRQDLTPGSPYADIALHGDGLTSLQFRPTAGAPTQEIRSTITAPTRLRIQRRGNQFTIQAGKAGEEQLTSAGPQTVELGTAPVYIGLAVCSHDANILETAVFSNVRLEQTPPAPHFRSKVTVCTLASRQTRTVYESDDIVEAPNWFRDGKYLLVNTKGNLCRLPLAGSGDRSPQLEPVNLSLPGLRCNNDHDLSPDGKRLAFSASSPSSRQSQVYVANADGSSATLITPAAPSYFHGWSRDGHWLAFVGQRQQKFELFRVAATGGEEQRLTSAGAYDDGPEYSPDQRWIYFNSNRANHGTQWDIWRMPVDGAGPGDTKAERVTSDEWEDWFPHFSPDGKWMLFFSFPKGTAGHNDRLDGVALRLMPAPGKALASNPKIETLTTFFGGQGTINVNSWSPDSKQFAYVAYEPLNSR